MWTAHGPDARRNPDGGLIIAQHSGARRLSDFVSGACASNGIWLWRVLDSGSRGHYRRRHPACGGGSRWHDFRWDRSGEKDEWFPPFGTRSFGWWRHLHPVAFRFLAVRGFHGKLVVSGDAGQNDLRDEGYRPQWQPNLVRTRDDKAFCEVAIRTGSVHRLHHGRVHGSQTGAPRSAG